MATQRMTIDLRPETYESLRELAHTKRLSMSGLVRGLITEYVEKEKGRDDKKRKLQGIRTDADRD